ncbi:MAG: hypothetical protein GX868_03765, partial [Actinobacteria bacterium]|nr:hypothetical protein [Actinomycetota bacterium]
MTIAATAVVALVATVFAFTVASADEVGGGGASTPVEPPVQAAGAQSAVSAAAPGVVDSVDFAKLETTPIRQWGVVGTGSSYTAAKPQVWDFAEIGTTVFVGGIFTGVQRNADDPTSSVIAQPYLAAFDRDTGEWISTFRPTFDRAVYALDVAPDGTLLVGGEFTTVNG